MTNGNIKTNLGKNVILYRGYTENGDLSSTQYLPSTQFKQGINNGTPSITSTDLDEVIPIGNGTVNDDGDNTLTGSNGGEDSTDNITTYKYGANVNDNTAQNLKTNGTSATKTWTIADLSSAGTNIDGTKYCGFWFYIKDSTTLAYFLSASTCLTLKLGSDSSNYYYKTWEASDLAVGWNWFHNGTTAVENWSENGTVAGNIDTFIIEVVTNNAADSWNEGDVIYDLLRTWEDSDLVEDFVVGYPTFDYTTNTVTIRGYVPSTKMNGFDVDGLGLFNEDSSPLITDEMTFTAKSKSPTDEFAYIIRSKIT